MDWAAIVLGIFMAGIIIAVTGLVKLIGRRFKKFRELEGAAELISGLIVALAGITLMFVLIGQTILAK